MRSSVRAPLVTLLSTLVVCPAYAELVDRIVAIVDRQAITLSEVEQAIELRVVRGEGDALSLPVVVERLIEAYLVEREVRRYPGEPVAPEEVQAAVESLRRSFPSEEAFRAALAAQGMGEEALQELLRRQMATVRYLEKRFRALVYVTDEEIQRYYGEELVPSLRASGEPVPDPDAVAESIRQILGERELNRRVEEWMESLKTRSFIRRYVW